MTLSEENHAKLWDELELLALTEESGGTRSDIATLLLYRNGFDIANPLYLFWELYRPRYLDKPNTLAPRLSHKASSPVLDILDDLHNCYRVSYEPDNSDSDIKNYFQACVESPSIPHAPDNLANLLIFIHVAAARAFTLKMVSDLSEEVLDCLDEVERAWQRLQFAGLTKWDVREVTDSYEVFHSIEVASALALLERSYESRRQGYYSEALHQMAEAAYRYESGIECAMGPDDSWPLGIDKQSEHPPFHDFYSFLTGMHAPLEDCLDTFRLLKESSSTDNNWRQVADDCKRLAHYGAVLCFPATPQEVQDNPDGLDVYDIYMEESEKPVLLDMYRKESGPGIGGLGLTWREFWLNASTWASDRLSPSEYRKLREEEERDEAQNRLKNYFFRDAWDTLPEQARERLITADVNWNSNQRMSREAILNDLLRATEAMCNQFIWRHLTNTKNSSQEFLHFLGRDSEIAENSRRSQPEVRDFIWACEQPFFLEFIEKRNLSDDVAFLTKDLPASMNSLTNARGTAEHNTGNSTDSEVIESAYQLFLGIGRSGILPKLAQVGRKLQPTRTQRGSRFRTTDKLKY